jgi:hypothetical protein
LICGVPALLEEIQYSCDVLKQVQLEAWHVANLHVLREQLDTADDLLKIDQSFFNSCLEKARLLATNDGEFELRKNRNVLRCANSACRANFWNRDVNATRNIRELLATRLMALGRIAAFARG